jgi:hypothetical protein
LLAAGNDLGTRPGLIEKDSHEDIDFKVGEPAAISANRGHPLDDIFAGQ